MSSAPLINLEDTPEKTKDAIGQNVELTPALASTSALPSTKVPLKRKIGPASKVGGRKITTLKIDFITYLLVVLQAKEQLRFRPREL
jgi:hypothetical protein